VSLVPRAVARAVARVRADAVLVAVVVLVQQCVIFFIFGNACSIGWVLVVVGEVVIGDGSGGCTGCDGDAAIYGNSLMPSILVH
jgi:hypothetical protein